ncbi:UDP-glucosyltransferase 2-like isoform X1 [Anopheles darlingi]|uniref:UDP-glucosyltransferase 2-like isoform X1 n=2 Tax=Anopheles darlingi TaxID=43151 RepID=UPI0021005A9C|nr:UDP-glucosyltransferase 2-like isoform X1 [Anopheles darlingi]
MSSLVIPYSLRFFFRRMCRILVLSLLVFIVPSDDAYRILGLFPHPGLSHFKVFYPVMRGLAEVGHNVTVVSYFPDKDPLPNYQDLPFEGQEILTNSFSLQHFNGRRFIDNFVEFFELAAWGVGSCQAALNSPALDKVLQSHQTDPYDLVIMEMFATDCMAGVSWIMRVPFVGLSSCALMPWHYDRVGLPDNPAYIPSEFSRFSESMTLWERMENWFVTRTVKLLYRMVEYSDNHKLRAKFPDSAIPSVREIVRNTSLILVNQHYTLSGARPLVPAVVEVGGIHIRSPSDIPASLKTTLDSATEGVIVVSFGSVLRAASLPESKRKAMVEAFKHFPHKVMWKWEETLQDQPENVIVQKWLPQREVLCHPNVRLFVSHGGLLGVSEAVHCGVPVVVMPIYGDQFLNAAALVNRGMGVQMDYEHLDDTNYIQRCLTEGLSSKKRFRAQAVSKAFRNRAQSPLSLALWSILNVIEHGDMRLEKSYGSEISWFVDSSLDVLAVITISLIAIIWPTCFFCRKIFSKKD